LKKKEELELNRIKNLEKNNFWMGKSRLNGIVVYFDDPVSTVNAVGTVTAKKLIKAGIETVLQLTTIHDDQKAKISFDSGLTISKLSTIIGHANNNLVRSNAPAEVDYRLSPDPYLAKYGPGRRDEEIKKSVMMSGNVCITDMVEHIYLHSQAAFRGTVHEDNWVFWHDALSLITVKDTVLWMKEKGIYKHWILPELDLYKDYPEVKKNYNNRPIGDTPEAMPLDNNLNQDLHMDVNRNVAATFWLEEDDNNKFSLSTPNRATSAYLRVWETVGPSPKRIIEDILKIIPSWLDIRENSGSYVGKVNRKGRRYNAQQQQEELSENRSKEKNGGARPRKLSRDDYGNPRLHADAAVAMNEKIRASSQKKTGEEKKI
jgi:hypothetical protein